jgi:hypothetical protein
VKESEQANKYINDILSLNILNIEKEKLYTNALHSSTRKDLKEEIELFKPKPYPDQHDWQYVFTKFAINLNKMLHFHNIWMI